MTEPTTPDQATPDQATPDQATPDQPVAACLSPLQLFKNSVDTLATFKAKFSVDGWQTPKIEPALEDAYLLGVDADLTNKNILETMGLAINCSVARLRPKLTSMKIYIREAKSSGTGATGKTTKIVKVKNLRAILESLTGYSIPHEGLDSLSKATGASLDLLVGSLVKYHDKLTADKLAADNNQAE